MKLEVEVDEYFRAAATGTKFDDPGQLWSTDRSTALRNAADMTLKLGPAINVSIQHQVMTSDKAARLNAASQQALEA